MKPALTSITDVHSRTHTYSFQTLKNRNLTGSIFTRDIAYHFFRQILFGHQQFSPVLLLL
jgi:hypothetical protein